MSVNSQQRCKLAVRIEAILQQCLSYTNKTDHDHKYECNHWNTCTDSYKTNTTSGRWLTENVLFALIRISRAQSVCLLRCGVITYYYATVALRFGRAQYYILSGFTAVEIVTYSVCSSYRTQCSLLKLLSCFIHLIIYLWYTL